VRGTTVERVFLLERSRGSRSHLISASCSLSVSEPQEQPFTDAWSSSATRLAGSDTTVTHTTDGRSRPIQTQFRHLPRTRPMSPRPSSWNPERALPIDSRETTLRSVAGTPVHCEIPSNSPGSSRGRSDVHGVPAPFDSGRPSEPTAPADYFESSAFPATPTIGTPKVAELPRLLARSATLDADDDRTPDHECSLRDCHDPRLSAAEANRPERLSHRRRPRRSHELPLQSQQ